MCRERREEKIRPRYPLSLPPLEQGTGGPIGDLYLLYALQALHWGDPPTIVKSPNYHQNPKKVR